MNENPDFNENLCVWVTRIWDDLFQQENLFSWDEVHPHFL